MIKIKTKDFRVKPGRKVDLDDWPTLIDPLCKTKQDYQAELEIQREKLRHQQTLLWANSTWSLLVVLQGMDASGKDSLIKNVMAGVDPQGCTVHSFKKPNEEELNHDYLWRCIVHLPQRGRIGIFNRSHYEEVVIARVHPGILTSQRIPPELLESNNFWRDRYQSMVGWEAHLVRNGTRVLKFFLHMSKDEQRRRFLKRLDDPEKNWKFNPGDLEERKEWSRYQKYFGEALGKTSSAVAPWYIIPADRKNDARLIVSRIIVEALQGLRLRFPTPGPEHEDELKAAHKSLEK